MTDKINGRTPEEIKNGLECCTSSKFMCDECPYYQDGVLPVQSRELF